MATTAICYSFKRDVLKGFFNFSASGGNAYKILLIKTSPSITYSGLLANVGTPGSGTPAQTGATSDNVGTDEASGTGYTSGGFTLVNVDPAVSTSNYGAVTFSTNPSWSSATFSATAAVIYQTTTVSTVANRSVSVHDFGGTQTVTSGTFTLTLPGGATPGDTSIIRIQ